MPKMQPRINSVLSQYRRSVSTLEIGCGRRRRVPGSVAVDVNASSDADIVHDLDVFPYPLESDKFDLVIAEHVVEHLDDTVAVLEELHRVTRSSGTLLIEVPHFSSQDFFTDPTHRRAFSSTSMDYFVPGSGPLFDFGYSCSARFKKVNVSVGHRRGGLLRGVILDPLLRRRTLWYERNIAFMFPVDWILYELQVLK
jgi:SAM-dependent methyltransferase